MDLKYVIGSAFLLLVSVLATLDSGDMAMTAETGSRSACVNAAAVEVSAPTWCAGEAREVPAPQERVGVTAVAVDAGRGRTLFFR